MPPNSDAVVNRALLDSWQSGLIALVCLLVVGLICWAVPFIVSRIYGKDGYRDREAKAREREADRQIAYIDAVQAVQEQQHVFCGRHAAGLESLITNVQTLCTSLHDHGQRTEAFMQAMLDSDGLGGFQGRVEVSVVELTDLALFLFDKPWDNLSDVEKNQVRSQIERVRKRHARRERNDGI